MEPDDLLVARLRAGDMTAFDALYVRYESSLFGFVRSYLSDAAEAEDVFHEAFVAVLKNAHTDLSQFRAWLYTTARNLCLNRLRSQKRGAAAKEKILRAIVPGPAAPPDPEERLIDRDVADALKGVIEQLPKDSLELFHLRASGLSYDEMASVLEVPLGTVKSRMHQLIHHLRKDMEHWVA